jgi:hypothetical protein
LPTYPAIPPTNVPPSATTVSIDTGNVLIQDDFSDSQGGWGTLSTSDSSIEYKNDALHMHIFTKNFVAWSRPDNQNYKNTHMEVTVFNNDTDPNTVFGFICAQQSKDWSFYYLAIRPAGEYAIIKATDGQSDVLLTNDGNWASSDLIPNQAASYRIGADCGSGRLTLFVNGKQVDSVSDNTYGTGRVGLFTWSAEKVASADVTFDDYLLTSPK